MLIEIRKPYTSKAVNLPTYLGSECRVEHLTEFHSNGSSTLAVGRLLALQNIRLGWKGLRAAHTLKLITAVVSFIKRDLSVFVYEEAKPYRVGCYRG